MKFKLIIAYDGTAYEGWQVQKTGTGVQEKVEHALAKLFPSKPRLHSSSRTDTGVHALGMVAHFEAPAAQFKMTMHKLALALNHWLPEDIRVLSAARAPEKFHARFDAKGKQYRYFVWNHTAMNPLIRGTAWHVPRALDLKAMRTAAALFVGKHDFKSFAANRNYEMESTVRTLRAAISKRTARCSRSSSKATASSTKCAAASWAPSCKSARENFRRAKSNRCSPKKTAASPA